MVGAKFRSPPIGVSADVVVVEAPGWVATQGAATTERAPQTDIGFTFVVFIAANRSGDTHLFFQYPTRPWAEGAALALSVSRGGGKGHTSELKGPDEVRAPESEPKGPDPGACSTVFDFAGSTTNFVGWCDGSSPTGFGIW